MSSYVNIYVERQNPTTGRWEHYCVYDLKKRYSNKNEDATYEFEPCFICEQGALRDFIRDEVSDYCNPASQDSKDFFCVSDFLKDKLLGREIAITPYTMTCAQIKENIRKMPKYLSVYSDDLIDNPLIEVLDYVTNLIDLKDDFELWFGNRYLNEIRIVFFIN